MDQRVSLVTLGAEDAPAVAAFYERLGWEVRFTDGDVFMFQAAGQVVAIWDRGKLAADSGVEDAPGWGGVTLAHNVEDAEAVDRAIAEARAAGARIAREPGPTFWGGYSGVFVDPAGHPWEVAHNPRWTIHPDGTVTM